MSVRGVVPKRLIRGPSPCDDAMVGKLEKNDQERDSASGQWKDDLEVAAKAP